MPVSFSGIASGIDGDSIIKSLIDAKREASKPTQKKVDENTNENTSLEQFNTKLLSLQDLVKDLLTLQGGSVLKNATVSDPTAIDVTVASNASLAGATIDVRKLARSGTASFADRFSALGTAIAPGLGADGKLSITVGTGANAKTEEFTVTSNTTLESLVANINGSAGGRLQASAINLGSEEVPSYALVVQSTDTGLAQGSLAVSSSPEMQGAGLFQTAAISAAQNAEVYVSGIGLVTRSKNQITDLIPGVSLQLKRDGVGPVQISVTNDTTKTTAKIAAMIAAVNEVIKQSRTESKIERVEKSGAVTNTFGALARTRVDDQALEQIRGAFSSTAIPDETAAVRTLADIGITIARDGTYTFKEKEFTAALTRNPTAVNQLVNTFSDKLGTTNGIINTLTRTGGVLDIARQTNTSDNQRLNQQLERLEANIERQQQDLKLMFSRLESRIGQLNSDSNALVSMISSSPPPRR